MGACLTLTIGLQRSTDNATPQSALTYEVFADGVLLGTLSDNGSYSAVWRVLHLRKAGPNTITAKAVDAAGNRPQPATRRPSTDAHADERPPHGKAPRRHARPRSGP